MRVGRIAVLVELAVATVVEMIACRLSSSDSLLECIGCSLPLGGIVSKRHKRIAVLVLEVRVELAVAVEQWRSCIEQHLSLHSLGSYACGKTKFVGLCTGTCSRQTLGSLVKLLANEIDAVVVRFLSLIVLRQKHRVGCLAYYDDRTIAAREQEVIISDEECHLCLVVVAVFIFKAMEVAALIELVLEHIALANALIQSVPVAYHWV